MALTPSNDRRIRRTKQTLYEGLLKLMQQKPIQQISVQELTQLCDLNRSTFYLHYSSIFQLLEEMEQEVLQGLHQVLDRFEQENITPVTNFELSEGAMVQAFQFLSDHRDFCSIVLIDSGDSHFIRQVIEVVRNRCLGLWTKMLENQPDYLADYFLSFVLSGCLGVIENWIKNGLQESPTQVAQIVNRFILTGASSFLNENNPFSK